MVYNIPSTINTDQHSEICVIVSWNSTCNENVWASDSNGIVDVGQPFYHVLTNKGLIYVSEGQMRLLLFNLLNSYILVVVFELYGI